MGMAAGGALVANSSSFTPDTLGRVLERDMRWVSDVWPSSLKPRFDPRNPTDAIVSQSPSHLCALNLNIADNLVFHGKCESSDRLLRVVQPSGPALFFCIYDSGGSHGFALVEAGKVVRRRWVSVDLGTGEDGAPLPGEQAWHPAVLTPEELEEEGSDAGLFYRHPKTGALWNPASLITSLIDEIALGLFSWSPINDDVTTAYSYYRAA